MFNFLTFIKEGKTVALLTDGGYNVTFFSDDRRTSVRGSVSVDDDYQRLSICKHVHNERHVGAAANQFDGVTYIL